MATIDLGKIRFNWQGAYNNSTAYVVNDVVSSGGNSYICKLASTGNAVSNGTYWDLMSSAGVDGTDLSSTLTNQGDVLYRDGSGLQKLGAGTSGQVLTTGGTGANPSWADAGGGAWEILTSVTPSNVASVDFTTSSWFPANQPSYALIFADFRPVTDGPQTTIQVGTSSGFITSSYQFHVGESYSSSGTPYGYAGASQSYIALSGAQGNQPAEGYNATVFVHGMNSSTNSVARVCGSYSTGNTGNIDIAGSIGGSTGSTLGNFNRIRVLYTNGNIASGRVTLYKINYA